jgi:uncharacterized protein
MLQQVVQRRLHLGLGGQRGMGGETDGGGQVTDQGRDLAQSRPALLQLVFKRIGKVKDAAQLARARGEMTFAQPDDNDKRCQQHGGNQQILGQNRFSVQAPSLPVAAAASNSSRNALKLRPASIACGAFPFDFDGGRTYHRAPMPMTLPDNLDPWRMVQAQRVFEGTLPLAQMKRLSELLASADGVVSYRVEFGRDEFSVSHVDVQLDAELMLVCQRSMAEFVQPVSVDQRLGLMRDESEEARLPEGYDPLLVQDGQLNMKDVIEDELILALPLVALGPGAPLEQVPVTAGAAPEDEQPPNPFAVLGQLKSSSH